MINWDWIITVAIIVSLVLGFWAKLTHQTIGELLASIKEMIAQKGEDSGDYVGGVIYD